MYKYVVVTPVKNEEKYFPKTIKSMLSQTIKPRKWIIVNDGSTDKTTDFIRDAAKENAWITEVFLSPDKDRKPGGESVLHQGLRLIDVSSYDFFVRMDGDISFEADYFEKIFSEFNKNPRLGIASGVCYVPVSGGFEEEKHPRFHTRGPIKTYRVECFQAIVGVEAGLGWDTVDEIKANILNWQTRSFPELRVIHYRRTQTASGVLKGRRNLGIASYYLGYHPLFMLARSMRNLIRPPYLLGGISMFAGYLEGYLKNLPRIKDQKFVRYLRKQQINRLLGKETIWK